MYSRSSKVITILYFITKRTFAGKPLLMDRLLGGVVKDDNKIVSAEATIMTFNTDWFRAPENRKEWERYFLDTVHEFSAKTLEPMGYKAIPLDLG